jgi:hypothetical protein
LEEIKPTAHTGGLILGRKRRAARCTRRDPSYKTHAPSTKPAAGIEHLIISRALDDRMQAIYVQCTDRVDSNAINLPFYN